MSKFRTSSAALVACFAACCLLGGCGGEKNASAANCSDSACTKGSECCAEKAAGECSKTCTEGAKACPASQNQN